MSASSEARAELSVSRTCFAPDCAMALLRAAVSLDASGWVPACAGATSAVGRAVPAADAGFASAESSTAISVPCDTLSPTLTRTSFTMPACVEGTSIVALSLSSVTSASSLPMVSPGLTSSSMTGTSLKSPMSGTLISICAMEGALEDAAAHVGNHLRQVGGEARAERAVDHAVIVRQRQRHDEARPELLAVPDRLRGRLRPPDERAPPPLPHPL